MTHAIHINPDYLTSEEAYRINGTLPPDKIEELLDAQDKLEAIEGIVPLLVDADQFPDEDFLQATINAIGNAAMRARGDNRAQLMDTAEKLDALQLTTHYASEYGRECLKKALAEISK